MTTEFISTPPHLGLYCVWIATGNPRQPLACIWIDPGMRTYELEYVRSAPVSRATQFGNKSETCRDRKARIRSQLGWPVAPWQWHIKRLRLSRAFALILLAVSVLLNPAWADVGVRINGTVADPSNAFVAGAAIALINTNNGTKRTATTNDEAQYSFPLVPVGKHELEVSCDSFPTWWNLN